MSTSKMPQTTGETTLAATSNIQWDSCSFGLSLMSFRTSGETERGTMRLAAMKDSLSWFVRVCRLFQAIGRPVSF
jgi:hypothetical protein